VIQTLFLVLMFLSGFLLYQYSQLLKDFPKTHWPIIVIVSIIILMLLAMGGIASYLEPADKQFLLIKEEAIKEIINSAKKRTYIFWLVIQTLFLVLMFLSGFLLYQYSQLLKDFPKTHWPIIVIVSIIILMLLA
ncbi:ABC transporter permease, partial [Streptococcus agalactiae]|nr:ABC transporter permease [Streptococcus agalactiae]